MDFSGINLQGHGLGSVINGDMLGDAVTKTRDQFGELRKAGSILSANPMGLVINELIFPKATADGTLEAAIKRGALNSQSSRDQFPGNRIGAGTR